MFLYIESNACALGNKARSVTWLIDLFTKAYT